MGWHIVGALRRVREHRIAIRDLPGHESLEIVHDLGIGIFANYQRRAGVANEYMAHAGRNARGLHGGLNIVAQVVGATPTRIDPYFFLANHVVSPVPIAPTFYSAGAVCRSSARYGVPYRSRIVFVLPNQGMETM